MYVNILCWDADSKELYGEEVTLEGELWPGDLGYDEVDPHLADKWHDKIYGGKDERCNHTQNQDGRQGRNT